MVHKLIDLHTHSTASDGTDTPAQLARRAAAAGLNAFALTDHDTIAGLDEAEAEARSLGLEFVRGCEISTMSDQGEMHILGLWLPEKSPRLDEYLRQLRAGRNRRNELILEKLRDQGIHINMDEIRQRACGSVGRPHIAAELVERGIVPDFKTAFSNWLGRGGKAHVPKPVPDAREAVRLLAEIGASPVIAHPLLRPRPAGWLRAFVADLAKEGLDGLEAWHSAQTPGQSLEIINIANEFRLGLSGGSDYHGAAKPGISCGSGRGNLAIGAEALDKLKERRRARGLPV